MKLKVSGVKAKVSWAETFKQKFVNILPDTCLPTYLPLYLDNSGNGIH